MGGSDRFEHKGEEIKGRAKETAGRASNDPGLEAEGRRERSKGSLKQAFDKLRDSIRSATRK